MNASTTLHDLFARAANALTPPLAPTTGAHDARATPSEEAVGRPCTPVDAPRAVPIAIGSGPERRFAWHHAAGGRGRTGVGVVLCNAVGDDETRGHRPLRHLAERLAAAGFDVLRFDFHGTGDSAGDERAPDRAGTWLRDVGLAIDELRARSGARTVALVGLRFGATLAAVAASRRTDVESLVLWSPYPSGRAFVDDVIRTQRVAKMLDPTGFASGPTPRTDGDEALGFFFTHETRAALREVDLHALTSPPARAALVVGGGEAAAEDRPLAQHLVRLGVACTYADMPGHKFLVTANHRALVPDEILDRVVAWLAERHPVRAEPAQPLASAPRAHDPEPGDGVDEQPLRFGEGGRLFGILVRPPRDVGRSPSRPAILMLDAGTVRRVGPHRLYVRMARRWAALGFVVLRLDLSGIGDSAAPEGGLENLCYPPDLASDVDAAMKAVTAATGADRFVLTGLCSGGDIAFLLGSEDPRVAGAVILNPRTFLVTDLTEVTSYQHARHYERAFARKKAWIKVLRGEVDLARATRMLLPKVRGVLSSKLDAFAVALGEKDARDRARDVPVRLARMVQRGVDVLLLVSEHDPGIDYVDVHAGDAMRALHALPGFRREDLPGSDHTFTSLWSQERVADLVTAHLLERHASGATRTGRPRAAARRRWIPAWAEAVLSASAAFR